MSPPAAWSRFTGSVLILFTRPPAAGRAWSAGVILALIFVIGLADYLTGVRISLLIFYLFPLALAVVWLGWREGVSTAVISLGVRLLGDYVALGYRFPHHWNPWNLGVNFGILLIVVWILHAFVTLHRQLEQRIAERTHALEASALTRRRLEQELLEVGSLERDAFGRELHDDLCQHLVATALAAKVLTQNLATTGDPAAARDAQAIVNLLESGVAKTRGLARGLLLSAIEPADFPRALADLAAGASSTGVICRFRCDGCPAIPSSGTAAQLFRIAEEAVRNALRHARPRHIDLVLAGDAASACLTITDDGLGLDPAATRPGGMGLRVMEHRAASVGARLTIVSAPDRGTQVLCLLPLLRVP